MAMYTPIQVPQPSPRTRKVPLDSVAPAQEHTRGEHRMRLTLGIAVAVIAIVVLLIALF